MRSPYPYEFIQNLVNTGRFTILKTTGTIINFFFGERGIYKFRDIQVPIFSVQKRLKQGGATFIIIIFRFHIIKFRKVLMILRYEYHQVVKVVKVVKVVRKVSVSCHL